MDLEFATNSPLTIVIFMSTTSPERTSLDSIVYIPPYLKEWPKLDHSDELAQLHSKFWGKDMAEEDEVRRVDQYSTSDPNEGEDDESKGDDRKTGYILEINNDVLLLKKILIRVSALTLSEISTVSTNLVA